MFPYFATKTNPLYPYVIYDASAGSGKTFTLVKEYLKLVLAREGRQDFRKILAITFTNKAVNEMKQRILQSLFQFSNPAEDNDKDQLFSQLVEELHLSPDSLRSRSKKVLKEILHNYAFFDISTIDKFNHRLIRTFARDLKLPQNFEVVLDTGLLLGEGVDRLIGNAGADDQLTDILVAFALEKIDDNKSWDIAYDLTNMGSMLFDENHAPFLQELKGKDLKSFLDLQNRLRQLLRTITKELQLIGEKALTLMDEANLEQGDFNSGYFPKFMRKVSEDPSVLDFTANWKQNFGNEPLYIKRTPEEKKNVIEALMPQFVNLWALLLKGYGRLTYLKNIYNNVVPLTLLNVLKKEIDALLEERDQLPISSFNTLISEQIKDQPAPFIYERLGEKYRHYFIDEFQDTSLMQWENLVPLISHALQSENLEGDRGSLFIVGDAKQAIYRWRGGRSELFLNLVHREDFLFGIPPRTLSLGTNYRSYKEVVNFNNSFFTSVVPYLNNELYRELFLTGNKQQHTSKNGGIVSLRFIEDATTDKDAAYCEAVLETIGELHNKGVPFGEISVLFRSNKQGVKVAEHLIGNKIPIMSSEALLLENDPSVLFLVNLLQLARSSTDLNIQFDLLFFLSPGEHKHQFISEHLGALHPLFYSEYDFDLAAFAKRSVYDALEYAIQRFGLTGASNAYISALLDEVLEVERDLDSGIGTFLAYWEKNKGKLSIPAPENINAVQLMTVHKSKGLEFPFVIFPYANLNIYNDRGKKIWVPAMDDTLSDFKHILISKKQEMSLYHEEAGSVYETEQQQLELDAFNLMYVALTRGIQGVYIVSEMDLTAKGEAKLNYFSGLFVNYLKEQALWEPENRQYDFGELVYEKKDNNSGLPQEIIPYVLSNKFESKLEISTRAGELWGTSRALALSQGNIFHYGMSCIKTSGDVEATIDELAENGAISEEERDNYLELFNNIVLHPRLEQYFEAGTLIKNEQPIITENGVILRPDRMVFQGKKVSILDYKTGKPYTSHQDQLNTYAHVLETMGYEIESKILVYIDDEIKTVFI